MDHQAPLDSVVPPSTSADGIRPVLAAMIGSVGARKATISRVVRALGAGLVVLALDDDLSCTDLRARHRELGRHLATSGSVVLLDASNINKTERRALLDVASRHWASTLAVVCISDPAAADLIASLPAEGWQAVVIAR